MRTVLFAAGLLASVSVSAFAQAPSPSPSAGPSAVPAASASPNASASGIPQPQVTTLSEFARSRIDTMLRTGHADAAWFSASFLAQVPATQVDAIVAQLTTSLGKYKSIDGAKGDYTARFEKGTDEVFVHLDADKKIDGLLFKPPKLQTSSLEDALHALRPSGGTLSYAIIEGRSERAALDASTPLAVGSAFKLAVLAALREINMTTQVTTKLGTTMCFSATVNDRVKAVDEFAFTTGYSAVMSVLANR